MRQGAETHAKLRRAALLLFVDRGIDAVSVRDIAEAAGVRPSTLYVHWPSRDALIADLFDEGYAEYGKRVSQITETPGPFRARFADLVRLICRLEAEDRTLFTFLLLSQHRHLAHVQDDAVTPIELIQRAVAVAMDSGEIPCADPALLTAALVGIVLQTATFHAYGRIRKGMIEMTDDIVALCLKVLAP
jgi:AcrR family transcriptional regulator